MTIAKKIVGGFAIATVLMAMTGFLGFRNTRDLIGNNHMVDHTHIMLNQLESLISALKDCETGVRGFFITGQDEYLEPYRNCIPEIEQTIQELQKGFTDNALQREKLAAVIPLIRKRQHIFEDNITRRRAAKTVAAANDLPVNPEGKETMDEIRQAIRTMSQEESSLLAKRTGLAEEAANQALLVIAVTTLLALLLMTISGTIIVRSVTIPVREVVNQLSASGAEILAGTAQQVTGAQEQAAAVAQTVTSVNEVTQTAEHSAQGARGLGETIQRTLEVGKAGRAAVEESISATKVVKEQIEITADNMLKLANHAQAIGEIIATVNDIAEQTNILALNAAIEATRAGEHGKGFSVVAGEVKTLAGLSKKATAQVRQILGDIQRAANTAVLSAEEVTKSAAAATKATIQSGDTIRSLTETLTDAARVSTQIVASAGQQATGMTQIHQAMRSLDQAVKQNMAATRQAEQAAQGLNVLGLQLTQLVGK